MTWRALTGRPYPGGRLGSSVVLAERHPLGTGNLTTRPVHVCLDGKSALIVQQGH